MSEFLTFLKWVGGKQRALPQLIQCYPADLSTKQFDTYVEPFCGAATNAFHILGNFPNIKNVVLNDVNEELILTFKQIRDNLSKVNNELVTIQYTYESLNIEQRKNFYDDLRLKFNLLKMGDLNTNNELLIATYFIFLNKTCFNGLYRVNRKGEMNTPFGQFKNPKIFDEPALVEASRRLKNVKLISTDYKNMLAYITQKSFVYIDPPYRPNQDAPMFTEYNRSPFGDKQQFELVAFVEQIDKLGAKFLLTNSCTNDGFFENLYQNFNIKYYSVTYTVAANASARGKRNEIMIMNY